MAWEGNFRLGIENSVFSLGEPTRNFHPLLLLLVRSRPSVSLPPWINWYFDFIVVTQDEYRFQIVLVLVH